MSRHKCTECGAEVEIDTDELGPWAGRGLLPPAHVICPACIESRAISVEPGVGDGQAFALVDGKEFRDFSGALVRSLFPGSAGIYYRDQK